MFDKPIRVKLWLGQVLVGELPAIQAFQMMGRSERYELTHSTDNIRTLHSTDAKRFSIHPKTPVVFEQ